MAIKGYIAPNTYTTIENTIYEKNLKRCTVVLTIYKDETKSHVLGNRSVSVDGLHETTCLVSVSPVSTVPSNIGSKFFLISDNAQDNLKGLEGRLARVNPESGDVETYILQNDMFLMFVEDEQKYKLYKDGQWVEQPYTLADKRIWDKWLAPEIALVDGTNPTKQMYKLMKTLPDFKNCTDV